MKIRLPLSLFFALVTLHSVTAKIWRVNNNADITADFTTLQNAHDGATAGDTLHLEGSATSYGTLIAEKKVIVIGTGYFLDQNPNTQAVSLTSKIDNTLFLDGSEGSALIGLDLAGQSVSVYTSNITIRRNYFASLNGSIADNITGTVFIYGNTSNLVITQNYGLKIKENNASTGLLIANNYIATDGNSGDATTQISLSLQPATVALLQNNIFRRGKVVAHNSNFFSNIMVAGFIEGTGNMLFNNIGNSTQFGAANNNKQNVDMSTVFVGAGQGVSPDGQWQLKSGSPAIGAGFGSTQESRVDTGMFGGAIPYVLSGLPPVPAIYFFENQTTGSSTDPIEVTIKIKSVN